ncbi:hypothetical protein MF672_038645 [Actinomadura sp. ATCC 31491]|uniref:Secreted protein n=1 Tax=Actinomadura luzonensis TaxID=2805427 RepID=A0ABT0G6E3_9ACTN|nr:hypothetical protein [Actinomadura luzonensis]MCK2219673.1 hypothetical protein [Actinomadura luzonensis]
MIRAMRVLGTAVHAVVLLLGAADALITACLGVPPVFPAVRRCFVGLAVEVRDRMDGVAAADIVDDSGRKVWL